MSHNQSRADRSDSAQYRKPGRSGSSNQQRQFQGSASSKGGGGAPFNPAGRSFNKKYNSNAAQGGQSRVRNPNTDTDSAAHPVHNGPREQQPTHVSSTSSSVKLTDPPTQAVPRSPSSNVSVAAPTSKVSAANPESGIPKTPAKGDASGSFPLQFGSISPGFMNGVQVPARTSSAPPNLDEQKKDQARQNLSRAAPSVPIPTPKKKDAEQTNAGEGQSLSKSKRDIQVSAAPPVTLTQKPAVHGMAMQVPFHQPQIPVQFGGPKPQIQSQAMPMQMPLPPMQQPMFISGLQPHPVQSQGMNFNFPSQMAHQLPPQLGSMGINMAHPQFPQQQASRKIVKITHPETHEELRLDGSPGPRSNSVMPPQSQPIQSFPPNHQMNFYTNSYNTNPIYFPASSVPLSSTQVPPTSQPPRFYNQVTVKPPLGVHGEKESLPASSSVSARKAESTEPSRLSGEVLIRPSKEIEHSSLSSVPHSKPDIGVSSTSSALSAPTDGSPSALTSSVNDARNQSKDMKLNEPGNTDQQDQVGRQTSSVSSLTSQSSEAEAVNEKPTLSTTDLACVTVKESSSEASNLTSEDGKVGSNSADSIQLEPEINAEKEGQATSQSSEFDNHSLEKSLNSLSLESPEITGDVEENIDTEITSKTGRLLEGREEKPKETLGCSDDVSMADNNVASSQIEGGLNAKSSVSMNGLSAHGDETKRSDTLLSENTVTNALTPENDNNTESLVSPSSSVNDKVLLDVSVAKSAQPRGKKKKKELYRKAEAAGTSSDLYMAYKGPEEKKETATSAESVEETSSNNIKQSSSKESDMSTEQPHLSKAEPDDWEDAEISPHLERSKNENQGSDVDVMTKRYSRDFLLKFVDQCTDLPEGFEISSDIADTLMASSINMLRGPRNIDMPSGGARPDRRASGYGDEDKWNNAANVGGFRPGQIGNNNYGVLRNPRAQTSIQYGGGILSGPIQSVGPQGVLSRNNSGSDRWQRATGFQKGLMPPPQTPPPFMHRAEKKYEIGKVTDEEEAKQRQLKGIFNKLTPQNFEKLFQQVKQINVDNVVTLSGVISQIFDKALTEPTFCEMYADFCFHLAADLPELRVDNEKVTFKRLLLNKCQEEFERGEREEQEANEAGEGESKQTEEEREEKRLRVRRRMLGNIRLIGELYKKKMLTERIMHDCIKKLLGTQHQNPDEENIEALCKLMSTIGVMIDHPKAKDHMDAYFDMMTQLSNDKRLSSRVRFMLRDAIDLRKNKWQQRRKVEGPKKIEEVHRDAAQERQAQTSRLGRGSSMGNSIRRGPSMDFAPSRSPGMLSPQMSSFRPQLRGHGSQDARADERHSSGNRMLSIPLPQRPLSGDDSITLGPQGGLVRGMAFGDARRVGPGLNGPTSNPAYGQRYEQDRFSAPSSYGQELNATYGNRNTDRFDKSLPTSPPTRGGPPPTSSDNVLSDEHLREKSMVTIKEFYSARDENEVGLCIKDLNAPDFYPSMISIWLTDSFERKDMERELLTKLLINLTKSPNGFINQSHFIKGFESVLAVLEDAVNDAPRAAEFLGRFFARIVLENVVPLSEIGRLIHEGGEEQGSLVEAGIAAELVGAILDTIKSEKGDSVLNEIRLSSNLQLHSFRPPGSSRSCRLDKFM